VTEKVRQPDGSLSERTVEYEYDELYRLIEAAVLSGETITYRYDEVGNRISAGARSYVYDDNDRLIEEREGGEVVVAYGYDDNGNLLSRTEGNETVNYTWDDRNRLIAVEENGERVEFEYDDDNIRVSQTVGGEKTSFLLDKNRPYDQVLAEFVDGEDVASYVYGLDLISQQRDGVDSFYFVDGLGSTRGLTDSSGEVTDAYWYDAYGNLLEHEGSSENDYLFAGEQFDEGLGQYYLRQRYYDAAIGRFTRRDTYEGRLNEPITLNKYLYANGNPVYYVDPSGLFSLGEISAANSIANILNEIQFDTGMRFLAIANGGEESPLGDLGVSLFVASIPALAASVPLLARITRRIQPGRTPGGEVTGKALGVTKADLLISKGNKQRRIWKLTDPLAFTYEAGGKHKNKVYSSAKGIVNPEPKDPLNVLQNYSVWIDPNTTTRRVGVDPLNKEFVIFDETKVGQRVYHGHTRTWKELNSKAKNRLIKSGLVDAKGNLIR